MKNKILLISVGVVLALSVGLIDCGGEQIREYSLTISSMEGGSVTNPGEGMFTYDEGTVVNLTAEAEQGYHFVNWTGDVRTIADVNAASTTITINDDYEIIANFSQIPVTYYVLTIAVNGSGSTSPAMGQHTYAIGTVVPISATPASGYRFVNWSGDVNDIANVSAASTTVAMHGNYEITANFEQIPPVRYNLTITSTAGGSVTTPGQGTFTYDAGMVVNMVATPASGYQFAGWTGDTATLSCGCQSTNVTMNGNYSIMANFEEIPVTYYTLTVAVNGSSSISPSVGQHTYAAGTLVSITATPASCCSFANWSGNVGSIGNVSAASTTIRMSGPCSITANFAQGEAVYFPDPNLEAVVREAIGKTTGLICASELEGLTNLYAGQGSIFNLTGLERCTNLTYLDVRFNQISDISPLANLTSLTELWLTGNQISGISPLGNLTNLTELDLGANQISSISSLANLTNLTHLNLGDNQMVDISPVANLTSLTDLRLYNNQISDVSSLANLTNLRLLFLYDNQISDISTLEQNEELGTGDLIDLRLNPLSSDSINIYIPQLQTRGVTVYY